jgi:splicing factor U2AF subunit
MDKIHRFGAVKSVNVVEFAVRSDNTAEDNIVELEDRPVKIECPGFGDTENTAKAGPECSMLNQSIDILNHSDATEIKDRDLIPESQDRKDKHIPSNAALCESESPVADGHTDIDDTQTRAALPISQHSETDETKAAADENKQTKAVEATSTAKDDEAVEKRHQDPRISEICSPAEPGDQVEEPGRDCVQQDADDATEDHAEKVPTVETSDTAFVFEPGSVLVEFTRREAACMAAHSLHGRRFGSRTVYAGYAPYDLYLQKYPR